MGRFTETDSRLDLLGAGGGHGEDTNGHEVSGGGDANVLELYSGNGCTTP